MGSVGSEAGGQGRVGWGWEGKGLGMCKGFFPVVRLVILAILDPVSRAKVADLATWALFGGKSTKCTVRKRP